MTKYMSVKDFVDFGFLQEINRQLLHPMGVAIQVEYPDDNEPDTFDIKMKILDFRDEPAGMYFRELLSQKKRQNILDLTQSKYPSRMERLGYILQPAYGE